MTQHESRQRLIDVGVAELPRDVNGMPDGAAYRPFLDITEMRPYRNVRSEVGGVWSGRSHQLASMDEYKVFMDLESNPQVISIREGYPIFPQDVVEDLLADKPVLRTRVMTIDFVLTMAPVSFGGSLRYCGLNSKGGRLALSAAANRRAGREEKTMADLGWRWLQVKVPSICRTSNLEKLREWAKAGPLDVAARDAGELATALYRTTSDKGLGAVLRMLGRRLGIGVDDQYFVFAAAYYLGYVNLEKEARIDEALTLHLARPLRQPICSRCG